MAGLQITRQPEIDPINVGGIEVIQSSDRDSGVDFEREEVKFDRSQRSRFSEVWD